MLVHHFFNRIFDSFFSTLVAFRSQSILPYFMNISTISGLISVVIFVVKVNFVGWEEEKVRAFRSWEPTQCRFGKLINAEKTLTEIRREKTAQPSVTMETIRCGAEICVIPHLRAHARNTQTNMARLRGRIKETCRVNLTYCQRGVGLAVRR